MSGPDVVFLIETPGDTAYELAGKAKELASAWGGAAVGICLGSEPPADLACDAIVKVVHPKLTHHTPDARLEALAGAVAERDPRLVLIANSTVGMDLGAAVAARWGKPIAAYCVDVGASGDEIVATSQLYGGKLLAEVSLTQGVCTVISGSFPAAAGRGGSPQLQELAAPASVEGSKSVFVASIEPGTGDVDITASDVLVSVGRGIESKDNVELAEEFAEAVGAAVSASRPITDNGWLPKTRQVGKSGLKVKPKAYLAFGISGAPEHLEGMRDAELIIACNTDPKAPIFDFAHYGTTVDLFDLLPALTERVNA